MDVQNRQLQPDSASGDTPSEASKATRRIACMKRLEQAISNQDLTALTTCFDPDYQSEFPVHLGRGFRGHAQMRRNWEQIFADVPDIHATLVRVVVDDETVWTEWDWKGTRADGAPFHARGVTIQTIPEDRITRVWLYMEFVQEEGPGTDPAVRRTLY